MKRRYYLKGFVRGVGLGMILTALIMGLTMDAGKPMTDAEVRAKALQLGMVDPGSLSLSNVGTSSGGGDSDALADLDASPSPSPAGTETPQPTEGAGTETAQPSEDAGTETPQPSEGAGTETPQPSEDAGTETPQPTEGAGTETAQPSEGVETEMPQPSDVGTVRIVIVRGDNSYTVSRRLQEAGLVENAREFDSYLVDNGYSKSIRTGTYDIPLGADWEDIIYIIT